MFFQHGGQNMKIKVEGVFNGHKTGYRMTCPKGNRETIYRDKWPAKEALDIWENVYGYKRQNIRFVHH